MNAMQQQCTRGRRLNFFSKSKILFLTKSRLSALLILIIAINTRFNCPNCLSYLIPIHLETEADVLYSRKEYIEYVLIQ